MSEPFRIAYVLKRYPRLSETFVVNEMSELIRQGVRIVIIAEKDPAEGIVHGSVRALEAPIHYLPPRSAIPIDAWAVRSFERFDVRSDSAGPDVLRGEFTRDEYRTLIQAAMIAPFLKTLGIQQIHAHFATWAATAASFMGRLTGIPYSFTAHAKDIYHDSVDARALAEKIEGARFVITVSDCSKRHLEALLLAEGRSGRVIRLYNGIDLDLFTPSGAEADPGLVVGVGRLVQKKGFEYLIDACRVLKDRGRTFRCAIVGDGEGRDALAKRVAELSLEAEVSLLGAVTQTEVIEIVRRATVSVLPCRIGDDGNRDALPTVLLESMALGVPVVSTRVAGIPEIISHGRTGLLVEERAPGALARAIESLLDSRPLRERLSRAALARVRTDFNLGENVKTLKGYFVNGLQGPRRAKG